MPDKRCCTKRCLRCWRNHMKHCSETYDPNTPYMISSGNAHKFTEIKDLHNNLKQAIRFREYDEAQSLLSKLNELEPNSIEVKKLENKLKRKIQLSSKL